MASISTTTTHLPPPTTAESFAAYSENITRAIMTATNQPAKLHHNFIDELPPAPPPSPVSFAIDSNGKPGKTHSKVPSMSLE